MSQDCTTALQPGQQGERLSQTKKKCEATQGTERDQRIKSTQSFTRIPPAPKANSHGRAGGVCMDTGGSLWEPSGDSTVTFVSFAGANQSVGGGGGRRV